MGRYQFVHNILDSSKSNFSHNSGYIFYWPVKLDILEVSDNLFDL